MASSRAPGSAHLSFTMAGVCGGGGVAGYVKARSVPSLVAGLACGGLFLGSGLLIKQGENVKGHSAALLTSSALFGAMAPRALRTKKLMPAGLVALLGAGSAAYHAKKTMDWWDSE
jgi:uncharacterized membrane protein (UPF0136 family)